MKPKSKPCKAMQGLIEEGQEQIEEDAEGPIKDLMLIAAAQKVEHYEISGYGSLRTTAEAIGNSLTAKLLRETEEEEGGETDKKLTGIAAQIIEEVDEEEEDKDGEEEESGEEDETAGEEDVAPMPVKKSAPAKNGDVRSFLALQFDNRGEDLRGAHLALVCVPGPLLVPWLITQRC